MFLINCLWLFLTFTLRDDLILSEYLHTTIQVCGDDGDANTREVEILISLN